VVNLEDVEISFRMRISVGEGIKDPDMGIANNKAIKTKILMQIPKLDW